MTRLSREDLRGRAQTVRGLIDPIELGSTLMHEHVLCDIREPADRVGQACGCQVITLGNAWAVNYGEVHAPINSLLDQVDVAIDELTRARDEGCRTVVDLSCGGLRPDPLGLLEISNRTDVHIVMGCGHYVDAYQDPANRDRDVESFAAEMIDQIFEGAWGEPVRAGMLGEIGCQAPWTALEKRVMEGAVIAMGETGAALNIHPGRDADQPQEIVDFLSARAVDMSRVVISHIDRTVFDEVRMLRLADSGCVLEFDLFGQENSYYKLNPRIDMPNDARRLEWLRLLIDRGHLSQITISHDICYRTRLTAFGGHGYGHIFRNILPMMRRRGFSEQEISTVMVETPRRLLTFV